MGAADAGCPGYAIRCAFDGEDEAEVEREMHRGPDLRTDYAEMLFVDPVEVDHVEKVEVENCAENFCRHVAGECEGAAGGGDVLASFGRGDGAFAEDDEGQEGHSFDEVRSFEAEIAPDNGDYCDENCLGNGYDVPWTRDISREAVHEEREDLPYHIRPIPALLVDMPKSPEKPKINHSRDEIGE